MLLHLTTVIWKGKYFTVIDKIMGPLKQWGQTAAISRYCWYYYEWRLKIWLHHTDLFYKLRHLVGAFKMIWPVTPRVSDAFLGLWGFLVKICFFSI